MESQQWVHIDFIRPGRSGKIKPLDITYGFRFQKNNAKAGEENKYYVGIVLENNKIKCVNVDRKISKTIKLNPLNYMGSESDKSDEEEQEKEKIFDLKGEPGFLKHALDKQKQRFVLFLVRNLKKERDEILPGMPKKKIGL
jgi:hypothetical protein